MPHLSPLNWSATPVMLWLALLMIVAITWWQQTPSFPTPSNPKPDNTASMLWPWNKRMHKPKNSSPKNLKTPKKAKQPKKHLSNHLMISK